jgi:hypothetical protein
MTKAGKAVSHKRVKSQDRELEELFRQAASLSHKAKDDSSRERADEREHSEAGKRK